MNVPLLTSLKVKNSYVGYTVSIIFS